MAERRRGEHPQDQAVGREHDHQTGDNRSFPHPGRLILQPVQAPPAGDEALEHPVGQAEDPHFLGRRRVHGEPVGVLGVALRLPDLLGVAVLPDRALPQQPVRREPRAGQHRRRPEGEAEEHDRLGEAGEHVHQAGRDEVHRDRQRRTGHAPVEVPGHLQVSGQLRILQVPDARNCHAGAGQLVVEPGRGPVAEVRAQRGVERAEHLQQDEQDAHDGQRHARGPAGAESPPTSTPVAMEKAAGSSPRSASRDHHPVAMAGSARFSAAASCSSCRARRRRSADGLASAIMRVSVTHRTDILKPSVCFGSRGSACPSALASSWK